MAGGVSYAGARPYRPGMPESIVYLAQERPDVKVLWEGVWCPGEMRMQRQTNAGQCVRTLDTDRAGDVSQCDGPVEALREDISPGR